MSKDIYTIRQLLSLYYAGMTSPRQEAELLDYFTQTPAEEIPADLSVDRLVLLGLDSMSVETVPSQLGSHLSLHIDTLARKERINRRGRRIMAACSIAASVAILLTVGIFLIKENSVSVYELTDPQEAQAESQKALLLVSECLNKADVKAEETDMLLERLGFDMSMFDDDNEYADSLAVDADEVLPMQNTDTLGV